MTAHPHAENMRLYAEDAAETDKPWERWELRCFGSLDSYAEWRQVSECSLLWHPCWEYRRKPKPLEVWLVYNERSESAEVSMNKWSAERYISRWGGRLIHMREVTE